MDNKENDVVMAALHDSKKVYCQSTTKDKGFTGLISRFRAMSDGFCYTVLRDNKCWIVHNNTNNEAVNFPFGYSMANFINDMQTDTAPMPDCPKMK